MDTAIIFGAGKTGRGFAAHLAHLGGYKIVLVDKNRQLVDQLNRAGEYEIDVLDNKEKSATIPVTAAFHIDDTSWHEQFVHTGLAFTAVFGNNLEDLAQHLAPALNTRNDLNPSQYLTIITCENLAQAASFLRDKTSSRMRSEKVGWLRHYVGFSEAIIFKTCLEPAMDQPPLTIRAQDFFDLPCDADGIKEVLHVYGLKPLDHFSNQLKRKIYTYNCINAVITYLGAQKGYLQLYQAANDPEILAVAQQAANETAAALVAEYGFDKTEQHEWNRAAFLKFADKNIPDPISRNGADPVRKLQRDDRLIGPALMALRHHIAPEGLIAGILACFEYRDENKNERVADLIENKGVDIVLTEVCGLSEEDDLFRLLRSRIIKSRVNGE